MIQAGCGDGEAPKHVWTVIQKGDVVTPSRCPVCGEAWTSLAMTIVRRGPEPPELRSVTLIWHSVESGRLPDPGEPILMKGDSNRGHRNFYISGCYDAGYRPLSPWLTSTGEPLSDYGWKPTHWMHLKVLEP